MKILFIIPSRGTSPGTGYTKFPDELLSIASVLEEGGHDVRIHDANMDERPLEELATFNPSIIGFPVATGPNIADSIDKSIKLKKLLPQTKIVWGFRHPSSLPEQTLVEDYIDYVIIGAGEFTLLELAQKLDDGKQNLNEIKGLLYLSEIRDPVSQCGNKKGCLNPIITSKMIEVVLMDLDWGWLFPR